jgi:outer membrane biosynthesis protein TonB
MTTEAIVVPPGELDPPAPKPAPAPAPQHKPEPAPKPAPAKPAAAAGSRTSAARSTVTVTLDPHVWEHFSARAEEEERSLAKYLQRFLREHVNKLKEKQAADKGF